VHIEQDRLRDALVEMKKMERTCKKDYYQLTLNFRPLIKQDKSHARDERGLNITDIPKCFNF
jgi:hypothetical protein